jgi:DNA repair exonuclease SbcCD ATPase subunit
MRDSNIERYSSKPGPSSASTFDVFRHSATYGDTHSSHAASSEIGSRRAASTSADSGLAKRSRLEADSEDTGPIQTRLQELHLDVNGEEKTLKLKYRGEEGYILEDKCRDTLKESLQKKKEPLEKSINDLHSVLKADLQDGNWQNLEQNFDRLEKIKKDAVEFMKGTSILLSDTTARINDSERRISDIDQLDQTIKYLKGELSDTQTRIKVVKESTLGNFAGDLDTLQSTEITYKANIAEKSKEYDNREQLKSEASLELHNSNDAKVTLETTLHLQQDSIKKINRKIHLQEAEKALQNFSNDTVYTLRNALNNLSQRKRLSQEIIGTTKKICKSSFRVESYTSNSDHYLTKEEARNAMHNLRPAVLEKLREQLQEAGWKPKTDPDPLQRFINEFRQRTAFHNP